VAGLGRTPLHSDKFLVLWHFITPFYRLPAFARSISKLGLVLYVGTVPIPMLFPYKTNHSAIAHSSASWGFIMEIAQLTCCAFIADK